MLAASVAERRPGAVDTEARHIGKGRSHSADHGARNPARQSAASALADATDLLPGARDSAFGGANACGPADASGERGASADRRADASARDDTPEQRAAGDLKHALRRAVLAPARVLAARLGGLVET